MNNPRPKSPSAVPDLETPKRPALESIETLKAEISALQANMHQSTQIHKSAIARAEIAEFEISRLRAGVKRLINLVNEQKLPLRNSGYFKDLITLVSPEETTRTLRILKLPEHLLNPETSN